MVTKTNERKCLDPQGRFGFFSRSKKAHCLTCTKAIALDESRVFDNELKVGPLCIPCAQRTMTGKNAGAGTEAAELKALSEIGKAILARLDAVLVKLGSGSMINMNPPPSPAPPPAPRPLPRTIAQIEADCRAREAQERGITE